MMTIGLAALLRGIVMAIWGSSPRSYPPYLPAESVTFLGAELSVTNLWALAIVTLLLIIFVLFFKFTNMGVAMRATASDQQAAQSVGIRIKRVFGTAWAISAATAALGGIVLGSILSVSTLLSGMGLQSISAAIVGGLESIPGVLVGGIVIGLVENFSGGYLESILPGIKSVSAYIVLLLILLLKPYGLFGFRQIERI
jgi:branched-chain amino acid transport system permease protein